MPWSSGLRRIERSFAVPVGESFASLIHNNWWWSCRTILKPCERSPFLLRCFLALRSVSSIWSRFNCLREGFVVFDRFYEL